MNQKLLIAGILIGLALSFVAGVQHGSNIKTLDMVEIYDTGKKEALKISPRPSLELEMTCANIWAGRVAAPEVLK